MDELAQSIRSNIIEQCKKLPDKINKSTSFSTKLTNKEEINDLNDLTNSSTLDELVQKNSRK